MSDILKIALKANMPVVRATSDDPVNVIEVIRSLTDRHVVWYSGNIQDCLRPSASGKVFVKDADAITDFSAAKHYNKLLENEATLVVLNDTDGSFSTFLDTGEILPEKGYMEETLKEILPKGQAEKFALYFSGMGLTSAIETVMLTQARDGYLSPNGINQTKAYLGRGLAGLEAIDLQQGFYYQPTWLSKWFQTEAPLFKLPHYRDLWPKGFLLHGPPGTGKTELALNVAIKLNRPLFRLDAGSIYSRWQGETESNLRKILGFVSAQNECVFLIDEAEKLFGVDAEGQASLSTMKAMLLWWLQSSGNRALVVMTTNDKSKIPPEMYRPGRLDAVHAMVGFDDYAHAESFLYQASEKFAEQYGLDINDLYGKIMNGLNDNGPWTQASLIDLVRSKIKVAVSEKEGTPE